MNVIRSRYSRRFVINKSCFEIPFQMYSRTSRGLVICFDHVKQKFHLNHRKLLLSWLFHTFLSSHATTTMAFRQAPTQKGAFYPMARIPVNLTPPLGTVRMSDIKKASDPLELAANFIGSYMANDAQYPEIGRMSLRKLS